MDSKILDVFLPVKDYIVRLEDFDLIKIIGRGSYGDVYYAIHKTTGTKAALKKLLVDELDEVQLEYFIREVLILAYYDNFFLVSFLGFSPSNPYLIITEFVPCGSLFDALRRKPRSPSLDGTDKTKIAIGIIEGMICLHNNKVIHRDLKSLNILLDNNKLPKICDFGISRAIDENNLGNMTVRIGTFHWMAPEMLDSDSYSYKVDVYAFAIILWEMLTGQVPYQGQDPLKILLNVKNNGMRPVIPPDCNEGLSKLMTRCWDQDPDVRPTFVELYEIFRDEEIHFNDANIDEIHKFFEQFPVSEDALHPKSVTNSVSDETKNIQPNQINFGDLDNVLNSKISADISDDLQPGISRTENEDNSYSEEESISISKENKNSSEQYLTEQRGKSESMIQQININDVNSLKIDSKKDEIKDSNEDDTNKDKKKDKKKDKISKKEKKEKSKEEKKKEKKKPKYNDEESQPSQLKSRRMTLQEKAFRKKHKGSSAQFDLNLKQKEEEKQSKKSNQPNKATTFDNIYDMEIKEIKQRRKTSIDNSNSVIGKTKIIHCKKELPGNAFSKYVNSVDEDKARLPYVIPLSDFEELKESIYTAEKDNDFLQLDYNSPNDRLLGDTESFILDDDVFKNFSDTSIIPKSYVKKTPTTVKSPIIVAPSYFEFEEEESEREEEENIEQVLRQFSGRGKIINIFQAELDEITLEDAHEVFIDMKNLIDQHKNKDDPKEKAKNDIYIYLLSNKIKEKVFLINKFNDINGFEILPISGNPIITPSFINLFSACILSDLERFPFDVFKEVFSEDKSRNSKKFLLLLQALHSVIPDVANGSTLLNPKKKEVTMLILDHFYENKKKFADFNEFPQFLYHIYSKLINCDDVSSSMKKQLIDTAIFLISSSADLKTVKSAYSILLSDKVKSTELFEHTKSVQLPLRTFVNHITSQPSFINNLVLNCGELIFESVSLFGRFEKPPLSGTLVSRLIEHALWNTDPSLKEDVPRMACLILCRLAKSKPGSLLLTENKNWMKMAVNSSNEIRSHLKGMLERTKNASQEEEKDAFDEIKSQLEEEQLQSERVSERVLLSLRILMALFISHVSLRDDLAKSPVFWSFLEASIRITTVQSLFCYNSVDCSPQSFDSILSSLKVLNSIVRRIHPSSFSSDLINNSRLVKTLCSKVIIPKIVERSPEAVELGLQLLDVIARATACKESAMNSSSNLEFIDDFVTRIPSLLSFGGIVAHKTIIASLSIFLLHKEQVGQALMKPAHIRSNAESKEMNDKDNDNEDNQLNVIEQIKKILPKVVLINEFEKYRKTFLELLAK